MKIKFRTLGLSLSAIALMATTTSCKLFQKPDDAVSNGSSSKKGAVEAVLPTDREQILKDRVAKTYTPEELSKGIIKGDWAIERVGDKTPVGMESPYLKFVADENRIYGNNGCNVINASYKYNPSDSTLIFENPITTMRLCPKEGITDREINVAMGDTRYYSWELKDTQYYLYLYNSRHELVMTLMHQNFDFLNGTWKVIAINENPVNVPKMKLVFDIDEGKVHGNTGCNVINGYLKTDMEAANSISLENMAVTRMLCPDNRSETEFLVALEDAATARPISKDKVLLLDNDGKVVLELMRSDDK